MRLPLEICPVLQPLSQISDCVAVLKWCISCTQFLWIPERWYNDPQGLENVFSSPPCKLCLAPKQWYPTTLWWLALYINLSGSWGAQIFDSIPFRVLMWGCSDEIYIQSVDWVKQITLPNVDCPNSRRPEGNKRLTFQQARKNPSLNDCLQTGISAFFLPLDSNWSIVSSWVSKLLSFIRELQTTAPPRSRPSASD